MTTLARRAAAVLVLVTGAFALAGPASAHPLGNFTVNRYTAVLVSPDQVTIDHVLDLAEIPTAQLGDRVEDVAATAADRCRAWSFSYPRTAARDAMCRLKNSVTAVKEDSCCVSGVRGAALVEPRGGLIEFSIDRYGGDYKSFDIAPDPTGASCAKACQADNKCRAFTYVRPGYASAAARCFLKDRITRPRRKPCCISGVVR